MSILYKRVLLKISGEALMGDSSFGVDPKTMKRIAQEIAEALQNNIVFCLVIGGGNIFRGVSAAANGIERTTADYMGMLATVMNALAFQSALEGEKITTRVLSALPIQAVCEPYIRRRAIRHLEKGRVVIFSAGTGNPFFTTDTAAALRATEMECDILLKGTQVNGVYNRDPKRHSDATHQSYISYQDVLSNPNIRIMDQAAVSLCQENNIPILVFNIHEHGGLVRCLKQQGQFTMVGT